MKATVVCRKGKLVWNIMELYRRKMADVLAEKKEAAVQGGEYEKRID